MPHSLPTSEPEGAGRPPLQVAVDPQGRLLLLPRVVQVHAAGEAQLVLGQAQLLEGLLRGHEPEVLRGKGRSGGTGARLSPPPSTCTLTPSFMIRVPCRSRGFLGSGSSPVEKGAGMGAGHPPRHGPAPARCALPCVPCAISRFSSPSEMPTGMLGLVGSVTVSPLAGM